MSLSDAEIDPIRRQLEVHRGDDYVAIIPLGEHTDMRLADVYEDEPGRADLLAAAPDMLKALEGAAEWLEGWASAAPYLSTIEAAIAKARGESN